MVHTILGTGLLAAVSYLGAKASINTPPDPLLVCHGNGVRVAVLKSQENPETYEARFFDPGLPGDQPVATACEGKELRDLTCVWVNPNPEQDTDTGVVFRTQVTITNEIYGYYKLNITPARILKCEAGS